MLSFTDFLGEVLGSWPLLIASLLTIAVILVNGWTDAPNAIATCVSTRAMPPRVAVLMAAVFNFFGIVVMTAISPAVAETLYNMVDFGSNSHEALIALCAAMVAIVIWATAAWWFGIPTSESHALIAGVTGGALAMNDGTIQMDAWLKVLVGLGLSTFLGFFMGLAVVKVVEFLFRTVNRRRTQSFFQGGQIFGGAAMAFMHGAQDGQKFMGIFLLGIALAKDNVAGGAEAIPFWLIVLCSVVMGVGTSIGGYRIIKAVGMDMVKLEKYQGFSADLAAAACLLLSSLTGIPVSTTHTKTTAIMGVGAAKSLRSVNWGVVKEMVLAWVLTFPGCGLIGFLCAKLFVWLF